jgi:hypothetical protein
VQFLLYILQILAKLSSQRGKKFINYKVSFSYTVKVGEDTSDMVKPIELYTDVKDDGVFVIELPAKNQLTGVLHIEVIAPDGEILTTKEYKIDELDEINIACDPKEFFNIPNNKDPTLGKRMKIYGKVLDEKGITKISNQQVILYGLQKDTDTKESQVILATLTDREGYFSGEYPRDKENFPITYSKAYGIISLVPDQKIPLTSRNRGWSWCFKFQCVE